jgi:hypothetical protein
MQLIIKSKLGSSPGLRGLLSQAWTSSVFAGITVSSYPQFFLGENDPLSGFFHHMRPYII